MISMLMISVASALPPVGFVEVEIPVAEYQLYDLGVADIDGDGDLDIWTANHTAEQSFLINDGKGKFVPAPQHLRLEMDTAIPGLADSSAAPKELGPLSFWFQNRTLHIYSDGTLPQPAHITLSSAGMLELMTVYGVVPSHRPIHDVLQMSVGGPDGGAVTVRPHLLGLPLTISIEPETFPLDLIRIGIHKAQPTGSQFTLALKDRHGHAWSDVNGDGLTDLFIARGGLRGEIENHPDIRDELLLRTEEGWRDVTIEAGLEKHGCRARQAEWIDIDGDRLLDLWVSGEDSPDLLFRNSGLSGAGVRPAIADDGSMPSSAMRLHKGRRSIVASTIELEATITGETPVPRVLRVPQFEEAGEALGLRDIEDGVGLWLDADSDGDPDLFLAGEEHLTLYRNDRDEGRFTPVNIAKNPAASGRGTGRFGFGRPCAGDLDGDGDLDLFIASPIVSSLLINDNGTFAMRDPVELGLPASSFAAAWVDADGDGDLDLHAVPDGLFIQDAEGRFAASGALMTELDGTVTEARTIWFDMDGDGDQDALMATIGRDVEKGHHVGQVRLWRNEFTTEGTENTEEEGRLP